MIAEAAYFRAERRVSRVAVPWKTGWKRNTKSISCISSRAIASRSAGVPGCCGQAARRRVEQLIGETTDDSHEAGNPPPGPLTVFPRSCRFNHGGNFQNSSTTNVVFRQTESALNGAKWAGVCQDIDAQSLSWMAGSGCVLCAGGVAGAAYH